MSEFGGFIPQLRGGLMFKSFNSMSKEELEFYRKTKELSESNPGDVDAYNKLKQELLFPETKKS